MVIRWTVCKAPLKFPSTLQCVTNYLKCIGRNIPVWNGTYRYVTSYLIVCHSNYLRHTSDINNNNINNNNFFRKTSA